jgi:hypothetical protein
MLAPIALYPDDLVADILIAATYPLDVVEAARWLRDPQNAALKGDQLFAALEQKPWDPSVKALAPFPDVLGMLDANLEWTEQLGEAYLADPAAVMDTVQGLRRRARSAGKLVTTPQEIVRPEQEPARIEEPITIAAPSPEIVYVPVCDPSFAYGPWPYPDYPPFFPVFAGASFGGCGWISGPIIAPLWGWVILNFHTRHIDIDRKRLALFDRDKDRERDRGRALIEEWRHDPGHRGNVPYRNAAVRARFASATPPANVNPAFRGRWTDPPRMEGPLPVALPQQRQPPGARPALSGGPPWPAEMRTPPVGGRPSTAGAQPRFQGGEPALGGVDPTGGGAPTGEALNRDAVTRLLIERRLIGPVPRTALAPPVGGLRASPPFGGVGSTPSLGDRRFFQPLGGVDAQPFGARRPAIGAQPLGGAGAQPRSRGGEPALEGVDPTGGGAPTGEALNRDAVTRLLTERRLIGPVPPTALAPPVGGLRASPSFGGLGSTPSLGDRRFFQPLGGVDAQPFGARRPGAIGAQPLGGAGAQPFGARGPGAIGTQPLGGRGPQPLGGMGAGSGRGGS